MGGSGVVLVVNVGNNKGVVFIVQGRSHVLHGVVGANLGGKLCVAESCFMRAHLRGLGDKAVLVINDAGGNKSEGRESLKAGHEFKSTSAKTRLRNSSKRAPGRERLGRKTGVDLFVTTVARCGGREVEAGAEVNKIEGSFKVKEFFCPTVEDTERLGEKMGLGGCQDDDIVRHVELVGSEMI